MNCREICSLYEELLGSNQLLFTALLVFLENKCIGRVRFSKELGIMERKARNIIAELVDRGIVEDSVEKCIVDEIYRKYHGLFTTIYSKRHYITFLKNITQEIIELINKHVVVLRDYIVLTLQEPCSLEVIGYVWDRKISIPRVPPKYIEKYISSIPRKYLRDNSVFVIWSKDRYKKYYSETALYYGLYKICSMYREV